ncbi:hypothetical protein [Paenibacillus whitsoniae]|uniref:Ferric oxidoreductase domain-containing protein n=1 Tax=Paenibacillus whitsoniae TaxID=2496558 RepID=A0A430JIS0_9BACL|nr:hypothetical protein [Paenibacillus whitsoniae]RTE10945.1 hypothetical protein EJQ19_04190 [Paenibacillus whitsoniae]
MNRMAKGNHKSNQGWIPQKEQIGMIIALIVAVVYLLWQLKGLLQTPSVTLHSKHFEHVYKDFGSYARIALFVVLAYYVLLFALRQRIWGNLSRVKKWLSSVLRLARRLHTPLAIIAIALIVLHTVAVFMYGFKFDFNNISGLLALLVLLPVPVSGILRYQRLDRKWHLRSGLAFAVLFLIHSFL